MRLLLPYFIVFLLTLLGTACNSGTESDVEDPNVLEDTTAVIADTIATPEPIVEDTLIHPRFMAMIKHIDSLGFRFDTTRYKITYWRSNKPVPFPIIEQDGYLLYSIPLDQTVPVKENLNYFHDTVRERYYSIDSALFDNVEILQYHFEQQNPEDPSWRSDGIIEQWKFPNSILAKKAAFDIGKKLSGLYFNRGALICYVDNYMYIIHSRAMGFYYSAQLFKLADYLATFPNVKQINYRQLSNEFEVELTSNRNHIISKGDTEIIDFIKGEETQYYCWFSMEEGGMKLYFKYAGPNLHKCLNNNTFIELTNGTKLPILVRDQFECKDLLIVNGGAIEAYLSYKGELDSIVHLQ